MIGGEPRVSESNEQRKRVDSQVLQTALLDEICERLLKLETLAEASIPIGAVDPLPVITATIEPAVYHSTIGNWFSVSIVNDGPSPCWIIVNTGISFTSPYLLNVREVYEVDMKAAKISDIRYYTDEGTADLRIKGVR